MSQENVEMVRRLYEEFERTGVPPLGLFHPEAEFDASSVLPDVGVIQETDQVLALFRDYSSSFEEFRVDVEEILDAGDHVVVAVCDGGRLKGSGSEIRNRFVHVWTVRDARFIRWASYHDMAGALEAVGLSE